MRSKTTSTSPLTKLRAAASRKAGSPTRNGTVLPERTMAEEQKKGKGRRYYGANRRRKILPSKTMNDGFVVAVATAPRVEHCDDLALVPQLSTRIELAIPQIQHPFDPIAYLSPCAISTAELESLELRPQSALQVQPISSSTTRNLTTLPAEIQLIILSHLSKTSSACLGLSCRKLYTLHWSLRGRVNLGSMTEDASRRFLYTMLKGWMGEEYVYVPKNWAFRRRDKAPRYLWDDPREQGREDIEEDKRHEGWREGRLKRMEKSLSVGGVKPKVDNECDGVAVWDKVV